MKNWSILEKKMVYFVYSKNKNQLGAAIALNENADQTWIIHGKKYSGVTMAPLMEGPTSALVHEF